MTGLDHFFKVRLTKYARDSSENSILYKMVKRNGLGPFFEDKVDKMGTRL